MKTERYQKDYIPGSGWQWEEYQVKATRDKEVPCVVLQAMIIDETSFLCEIVTVDDFYGGANNGSADL
jgi:hypothetical protein